MSLWVVFMVVNITLSEKNNHLITILTEPYHTHLAKAPLQSALFFALLFSAVFDVTKASGLSGVSVGFLPPRDGETAVALVSRGRTDTVNTTIQKAADCVCFTYCT